MDKKEIIELINNIKYKEDLNGAFYKNGWEDACDYIINNINRAQVITGFDPSAHHRVGGRIFYDNGANSNTYTFYTEDGIVITDLSISGLTNAYYYDKSGSDADRFYAYDNTTHITGGVSVTDGITDKEIYWDYHMRNKIGITTDGIGRGKTNTATALAFVSDWGNRDIWSYIKNCNNDNLNGCNDWFIMSKVEQDKLRESGLVDWYNSENIWSSVEYDFGNARYWRYYGSDWGSNYKDYYNCAFAGRAF